MSDLCSFIVGAFVRKYLILISSSLSILSGSALAQEASADGSIVVTAHGDESGIDETGLPITILTPVPDGQGDIIQLLQQAPGAALSRNGGPGSFTALRLRGSEAEQVLVLIDGVRMADAASPGNGFDFGTLLPSGIGKVEILRGPNSVVWGSQAIAGVVSVESLETDGAQMSASYGGRDAVDALASLGMAGDRGALSMDGVFHNEAGISSAENGSEADAFRQWQLGGRGRLIVADGLVVKAGLRHADARLDLDGFPAPEYLLADTDEFQRSRQSSAYAAVDYSAAGFDLNASWSGSDTKRENFDSSDAPSPSYATLGKNRLTQLRGRFNLGEGWLVRLGAERDWSSFRTSYDQRQTSWTNAAFGQFEATFGHLTASFGTRLTDHEVFGSDWTFGSDAVLSLGSAILRASYGEGFKAPSLFQLLSDYGNEQLRPERSRSFDIGGRLDLTKVLALDLSLFRRDSHDLIGYVSCFGVIGGICADRPYGTYENIGEARAQGVELGWQARLSPAVELRGNYSFVEATNRSESHVDFGKDLARRPRHTGNLMLDWWLAERRLQLGADLRAVSSSYDDAGNYVPLAGYATANLRADYAVTEKWHIFGRIENLWDEQYQTAAGYGTPGRGVFVGLRGAM